MSLAASMGYKHRSQRHLIAHAIVTGIAVWLVAVLLDPLTMVLFHHAPG